MPALKSDKLGLLIDTGGCPNRCAHCRVKGKPTRQMSYQEMRWIVKQFRELRMNGRSLFNTIEVGLWFMEPDFRDDYRTLWDLERELSDVEGKHAGLLSVWRIPRDDAYLPWVKEKGGSLCQITFFGVGATHDRFTRHGAFRESIEAMKRLVEAEIAVQWLLIFTKAIIPDLDKLLRIADDLRLPEEATRLGYPWQPVLTDVNPVGRGRNLERVRPSLSDLKRLPQPLRDPKRVGASWRTEAEYTRFLLEDKGTPGEYETLWLHIDSSLDVFPQFGDLEPWYCLGNLRKDGAERIIEAYVSDETPGQHAKFVMGAKALAEKYGNLNSELLYSPGNLLSRWITQHYSTMRS